MRPEIDLLFWAVHVGFVAVAAAASVAHEALGARASARRDRQISLRDACGAVVSIALTRERLREGATHAYVRGVAHLEDGVLFVRDATGIARIALRAAEIWRPTPLGFRRAAGVTEGSIVVACGPASDGGHDTRSARAIDAVIDLVRQDRERPIVIVAE